MQDGMLDLMKCLLCMLPSDTNKVHLVGPAQCGCRNVYAMSSAALLDEAIKQVDDLIIQLEANTPPPSTAKTELQPPKPAAAGTWYQCWCPDDIHASHSLLPICLRHGPEFAALPSSGKPAVATTAKAGKSSSKQQSGDNVQPGAAELFAKAQLQVGVQSASCWLQCMEPARTSKR